MFLSFSRVRTELQGHPLHTVAATRAIETQCLADSLPYAVMAEAGRAVAKMALALAPHARHFWLACGPGNNGGDGLVAALQLHQLGKKVSVTLSTSAAGQPDDAARALREAKDAGVVFCPEPPKQADFCIDALLGIGAKQEPQGKVATQIEHIKASGLPVLAVDTPSGLCLDTGVAYKHCVRANWTLSLLTLKPGFFTADGRDMCGEVWLDELRFGQQVHATPPRAWLGADRSAAKRLHASHKGSYGDVSVLGGAQGMTGAAILAASAALHGGAGRVFVGLLDDAMSLLHPELPELMLRRADALELHANTVVCGCGGSDAIEAYLPRVLNSPCPVVLDADALNVLARMPALHEALRQRARAMRPTVLTPHPLEAARLLGVTSRQIQSDRLSAAQELSQQLSSTVVLKGSGTIVSESGRVPVINPTGNPRLAIPGSGDVLAGMVGALLGQGLSAFDAACQATFRHGLIADKWPINRPLTASALAGAIVA